MAYSIITILNNAIFINIRQYLINIGNPNPCSLCWPEPHIFLCFWHLYNVFRSAKSIQIHPINPILIKIKKKPKIEIGPKSGFRVFLCLEEEGREEGSQGQGREEGREQGREEGWEQGREESREQGKPRILRQSRNFLHWIAEIINRRNSV